jgi:hypothetical protein
LTTSHTRGIATLRLTKVVCRALFNKHQLVPVPRSGSVPVQSPSVLRALECACGSCPRNRGYLSSLRACLPPSSPVHSSPVRPPRPRRPSPHTLGMRPVLAVSPCEPVDPESLANSRTPERACFEPFEPFKSFPPNLECIYEIRKLSRDSGSSASQGARAVGVLGPSPNMRVVLEVHISGSKRVKKNGRRVNKQYSPRAWLYLLAWSLPHGPP